MSTAPVVVTREHYLNVAFGWKSWLLTTDHKRVALLFLMSITLFFFLGGAFATLIRLELMTPQGDLFQAIQSLRPQFLTLPATVHSRGSAASAPISVYIDRARQMGVQSLRTIAAINVAEVRYLDPTESQNQFGAIASSGAILVKLYDSTKNPDA